MRFNVFFALVVSLLGISKANALELQTRRHPLCGVEKHVTLQNDSRCPVDKYVNKVSDACPKIYQLKQDLAHCGADLSRPQYVCVNGGQRIPKDPDFGCPANSGGHTWRMETYYEPAFCRDPSFPVVGHESCRDPSHGVESYQPCTRDDFPVESYKECSFYKTPEELAAYIEATDDSVETYRMILPTREGELLTRLNSENAMACLVDRYDGQPIYEQIVTDLKEKFLLVFGSDVADAVKDCSDETLRETKIKFTLGDIDIDCDAVSKDAIAILVKPALVSDNQFLRFKQNCTLKKSYDMLVDWFQTKSDEVAQLQADLAAKADPAATQRLLDLKTKLDQR